ncbi:anti-sigma factor RsbA family regulatory protein [Actinopolymorpha pittospori]|uniref:Anti-sigma regulatory factor (Ser/Thr protein kinase) n=1 Tax=Actinopolymorpha pittospori TaxID=648752 RepID=A0A927MU99_9ACTN|nr:anti-sigma factor RsbA family regulatory protein [Actinopolymorpha pittospori]MBE1606314.1 anti-sigma regulatory factor (Ser/Thr protein kinase) [Actinopolymorpha pittospori]
MDSDAHANEATRSAGLVHAAVFYPDMSAYLDAVVPFVVEGAWAGDPVLVVGPSATVGPLRARLRADAPQVTFIDACEAVRNPTRLIPALLDPFFTKHHDEHVRVVCESLWPGRSEAAKRTAVQTEALLNVAHAGANATILCPYDVAGLETVDVGNALRTHPVVRAEGREPWANRGYADPTTVATGCLEPFPEPAEQSVPFRVSGRPDLFLLRAIVAARAALAGLPHGRREDFETAVNEVATNALVHTGGPGIVRLWTQDDTLVCEVRDEGHLSDVLVGRRPIRSFDAVHGRGLFLVNEICDLVQINPRPDGTIIRLHMDIHATERQQEIVEGELWEPPAWSWSAPD